MSPDKIGGYRFRWYRVLC